jgi:hypothetical protein
MSAFFFADVTDFEELQEMSGARSRRSSLTVKVDVPPASPTAGKASLAGVHSLLDEHLKTHAVAHRKGS